MCCHRRSAAPRIFALGLLATLISLVPTAVAADVAVPMWQETAIHLNEMYFVCFDATHPNVLLTFDGSLGAQTGTAAYNVATGEKTIVQTRTFETCNEQTGWLFARNPDGTAFRFSLAAPAGMTIDHFPTHLAADGSQIVYALAPPGYASYPASALVTPGHLWMSADSGATWTERGGEFGGKIRDIAVVESDPRALYALVEEHLPNGDMPVRLTLFFSADAGMTWEQRSVQQVGLSGFASWPYNTLRPVRGKAAPATAVIFSTRPGYGGSGVHSDLSLSTDGGRTFQFVGASGLGISVDLLATSAGILRLNLRGLPTTTSDTPYAYTLTTDGGATWQPLALPYQPAPDADSTVRLEVAAGNPALVFLISRALLFLPPDRRTPALFASPDGGVTWQRLADYRDSVRFTPSMPLTAIGFTDHVLATLDLSGLGV